MLPDGDKTREQLRAEIEGLRQRIAELEALEDERKRADEELIKHRDHLEKLVGERTAELKALNWHLQQQITERKQAEQALERTSKDLQLVNLVNNAANQGYSLLKILQLVVQETKKMFSCNGATFYEISEDNKYLVMQNLNLSPTVVHQIEKLIGRKIPTVRIRLRKGSLYLKALQAGKPQLINDPGTIQGLMAECTANRLLKKLVPRINQLLGIASVMQTPLISEGEVIGLLDISRKRPFTESELERFATIAQQLLLIIKRRRAEETLQVEKDKLQSVIDALEYGLTIQDRDYNILYQSGQLKKYFGDYLGDKCYRVYEGQDKVCDGCPVKKAFRDGKSHSAEKKGTTPSGEVFIMERTASPIRNAEGKITSCLEVTRDFTERKRAEEKRQAIIKTALDGFWLISLGGKFLEVNDSCCKMLGYTREEILKMFIWDIEAIETPKEVAQHIKKIVAQGHDRFETRHRCKDGKIIDVEMSVNYLDVGGGQFFAFARDITERKRAEEALQTERNKLQSVIDAIEYGLSIQDRDYKILYQSQPMVKAAGDHLGEKCYRAYEARDTVCDGCPVEKAFKDGKSHTAERKIVSPSGRVVFLEHTACPVKDAGGRIVSCIEIPRNITERKKAEEAVIESEEKLRKMFESVTDGISVVNLNGIITEVNQRTVEMHGFGSKDEVLGKNAFELVAPCDHKRVGINMRKALTQGVIKGVEYTLLKADGSEFPGELSTSVLKDASGKAIGHITILRDITERKEAEEREKELQQELNLASRLAAVGELAAGVAHEMNNPLTGIMGFSERLLRKSGDDDAKKDLEIVHSEAQRLAKVVKNLLIFARQREPAKEYADINDIMQRTLELRAYELKSSNIEVALDLTANLPQIMVDFHQIQEVFLNIILNAEQVMAEASGGGKLTIKTRQIKDYIRISFTDDGPGIPVEHLDRVFNPFFTTKGERGGTGLGLSVCHGIVTEHGGRIYARSKPGSGATFLVDLPLTSRKIGESQIAKAQLAL